ncbi:uncharacterized protein METZ01_LOCUS158553, partial [marine metagenome]
NHVCSVHCPQEHYPKIEAQFFFLPRGYLCLWKVLYRLRLAYCPNNLLYKGDLIRFFAIALPVVGRVPGVYNTDRDTFAGHCQYEDFLRCACVPK